MIKSNVPPIISGAAHPVGRIEHVEDWGELHTSLPERHSRTFCRLCRNRDPRFDLHRCGRPTLTFRTPSPSPA